MPKINLTANGGTATYSAEDWLSGEDTSSTTNSDKKIGNGLSFADQVDPLRSLGYISPSFSPTSVTNGSIVDAVLRNAAVSGDNAYIVSGGSKLFQLATLAAGTLTNDATWPHTIDHAHSNETGDDIVNYYTGTTLRTFYSFRDATDWDVGIYNQVAGTFDDDFMSTVPASPLSGSYLTDGKNAPHPLIVGDDDVLYIGDRNFVHAYDGQVGAAGTFYPAVLTLPHGCFITSFANKNDFKLAIGAYYSPSAGSVNTFNLGSAKVWQWNYLDLDPDYSYDLHDNYVSELFNWKGTIAAFTSGRKTETQRGNYKLQVLNDLDFEPVQTWNTGGLPIRGGVDVIENDIYWNSQGRIYFFVKNPYGDNYIFGNLYGTGSSSSGLLKSFTNIFNLHFSDGTGASSGLRYIGGSSFHEAGSAYGKVAVPLFPEKKRGRLKKVDIFYKTTYALGTGSRSFRLNTELDKDGGQVTFDNITAVPNIRQEVIDSKADGTPLGDFSTLSPQLIWQTGSGASPSAQCPVVDSVVYHFEFINIDN